MSRAVLANSALILGAVLAGSFGLIAFLVLDLGGPRDNLLQQSISPDGRLVAELHESITPQRGGPDTLYVTLRLARQPLGDRVYSRTYECSDLSAFRLRWDSSNELALAYGACDSGHWHSKEENTVWKRDAVWRNVKITYEDTKHVATR